MVLNKDWTLGAFQIDANILYAGDPYVGSTSPEVEVKTVQTDDNDGNDEDTTGDADPKKTGSNCWENGDFVGTDECDTGGLPLCSEIDEGRCFDEQDFPEDEEGNPVDNDDEESSDDETVGYADQTVGDAD